MYLMISNASVLGDLFPKVLVFIVHIVSASEINDSTLRALILFINNMSNEINYILYNILCSISIVQ